MHHGAWWDLALEIDWRHHTSSQQYVGKSDYLRHQLGHWCPLSPGDSASLEGFFEQRDLGDCSPLGTHSQVECSLQERPKGYLEALCMEVCGLTTNSKRKNL
jgi:hypothetical protein